MELSIERAAVKDVPEILALQKAAFRSEAEFYGDFSTEPPVQTGGRIRFSGESMSRMPVGNPRRSETLRVLHDGAARVFLGWVGIIPNGKPYRHPGGSCSFPAEKTRRSPDTCTCSPHHGTRFFHPMELVAQPGVEIHVPPLDRRDDLLRCQPACADGFQPAAPVITVHFGRCAFHQISVDENAAAFRPTVNFREQPPFALMGQVMDGQG